MNSVLKESELRSQRGTGVVWTELDTDMNPPFVDNRAPIASGPPEERRYQAAYVDNDAVTTDWSGLPPIAKTA